MHSTAVNVMFWVCHYTVFMQSAKKLARSMFYGNLELPELDKIQTIKELL